MHHWLKGRDAPGLLVTKSAEMMHFGAIDASVTKPNIVRVGGCERLHKVVKCCVSLLYVEIGLTITPRTNEVVLNFK